MIQTWNCHRPGNQGSERMIEIEDDECPCCAYVVAMNPDPGDGWTVMAVNAEDKSVVDIRHVAVLMTNPNVVTACVAVSRMHVHENKLENKS